MVTEQLPYVDTRPGLAAGAATSTALPPMVTGSESCVSLFRAAVFQPRISPELQTRGSWARGAEGREHPWELPHQDATSLTPQFFNANLGVTELGSWSACLMARHTPRLRVSTVLGWWCPLGPRDLGPH